MTWVPVLTPQQEEELCDMYLDGIWKINDLSVTFKVSLRTVYRILAKHNMPKMVKQKSKKRKPRKTNGPRELKPCGTDAAYQRHRRKGEYPCTPCLEAHAERVNRPAPKELKPCGTDAAYQRHVRKKEPPCEPCRLAHNERKRKK